MSEGVLPVGDGAESVFRSVADAEVSLDEMLSLACRQGKQDIVELLLESGAKVNYRNKAGNTPLLEACSQGHVTIARLLLERKADIDAPTETTSDSALTWACTLGNEEVVCLLLEHNASIEHRTRDGCTALMFAALAGHDRVAKLLLEHKAQLNVESDSNKDSPLTFACWKGHQKVVELFLSHHADIEHRTKEGFSPLMFAALGGHTEVARLLLERRAQVNSPSGSNNDIPLTSACWKGHRNVVELLLQYDSDIEHHTKDGCTPLMLAAREGHLSVAQLLLHHHAHVNTPSGSENNIPLTLACWKGHRDVVHLLLQYSSNIEHQNKAGCTPLMLAAREGHYDATELLLDHTAQINVPSGSNDDTPLTLACWKGHENVVTLLLDRLSNVNHQTKTGCTPLMEATREGHVSVAKMLLEAGADVETPDNYGQTPFFMACWKGHAEVASLLLDYGANKDCRTKTGITPFFQACRENHVDVVKLLLDYGCNPSAAFPNSRECPLTLAAEKGFSDLAQLLISRNANVECRTKKGCTPFFLTCKEGFQEIAVMLAKHGADTEATDQRGVTPLQAAFRNGHIEVVEWLLGHVAHLPSDVECQKALLAPKQSEKSVLSQRSRCMELIMKAKKAREQAALKNAQILFEELDAEQERKENKRKAAARKRSKRKEKKRKELAEKTEAVQPVEVDKGEDEEEEEEDAMETAEPVAQSRQQEEEKASPPHSPSNPVPPAVHTATEAAPSSEQGKKKRQRRSKRSSKRNRVTATPLASSLLAYISNSGVTGGTERNESLTPAQGCYDDEESGDEMFVDAPSEFLADDVSSASSQGSLKEELQPVTTKSKITANSSPVPPPKVISTLSDSKLQQDRSNQSRKPAKPVKTRSGSTTMDTNTSSLKTDTRNKKATNKGTLPINTSEFSLSTRVDKTVGSEIDKVETRSTISPTPHGVGKVSNILTQQQRVVSPVGSKGVSRVAWKGQSSNLTTPPFTSPPHKSAWNNTQSSTDWANEDIECLDDVMNLATDDDKLRSQQGGSNDGGNSSSSRGESWTPVSTVAISTPSTTTTTTTSSTSPLPPPPSSRTPPSSSPQPTWQEVSRAIKTHQLTVSNSLVGRIIGRKGSKINQIQETSGAQISISRAIPRSVERLVTVKGTERSVSKAKELIEEALSTPSKGFDNTEPLQNSSDPPTTQSVLAPSQKRHSDIPVSSSAQVMHRHGDHGGMSYDRHPSPITVTAGETTLNNAHPLTRTITPETRMSVSTSSYSTSVVTSSQSTASSSTHSSTDHPPTSPNQSTASSLLQASVQKHSRSLSEPLSNLPTSTSARASPSSLTHTTHPLTLPSLSNTTFSPSMPTIVSPQDHPPSPEQQMADSPVSDQEPPVMASSATSNSSPTQPNTVTTSTVSPTEGVKTPVAQREVLPPSSSSSDTPSPAASAGGFGAIGPPTRRSSLPVTSSGQNMGVFHNSPRKLSYAGISGRQTKPLGVVPESAPQNSEYPLPFHPPPPHPPTGDHTSWHHPPPSELPHYHAQPGLSATWSSSNSRLEWPTSELDRPRSHSMSGGMPGHVPEDSVSHRPPFHPPHWGKSASLPHHHHHRPPAFSHYPHSYAPHPHAQGGFNAPGYRPPMHPHFVPQKLIPRPFPASSTSTIRPPLPSRTQSHTGTVEPATPMSLRDVLGENLEREIFPSDAGSVEFNIKDEPPTSGARQRWSVATFPPQLASTSSSSSTIVDPANGIFTNSGGAWSNAPPYTHGRHSVTVGAVETNPSLNGGNSSWPTWPGILSQQSQSFSLPAGLGVDSRWSPLPDQEFEGEVDGEGGGDLEEMMRNLDIADHIPALKNRKLSLQQLHSMDEEEWRNIGLPVGPRVKLMNAVSNISGTSSSDAAAQ